ncbi:MAG: DUF4238 domain-containing protein [candidate division NC10 bacterium]|nr:DUF4238 domain-containing protein [candidate division NC10 bacterium]
MATKRQHFIPRFLQEGFASHTRGGAALTWVHRKGGPPFNSNIINVGVEGFFYTEGDDTQADDLITDAEDLFSTLVRNLRTSTPAAVSDSQLPRLISHLEVRTRHVRQSFLRAGDFLVSRLLDFMADEHAFTAYLERKLWNDPSIFRESLSKELAKQGLPQALLQPLINLSAPLLPAFIAQLRPNLPKLAEALRSTLPKALKDGAKSGHIRVLKEAISPETRIQRYESLTYSVVEASDGPLILGDSVVLFRIEGPRPYKAFLDKDDALTAVFLPLSSTRALIGTHEGASVLPPDLRQALARCALEYFIAAERSDANDLLKEEIGEDAALLSRAELEEIITELMRE